MVLQHPLLLPSSVKIKLANDSYLLGVLIPGTVLRCDAQTFTPVMRVQVLTGPYNGIDFELPNALLMLRMRQATPMEALLAGNSP